MSQQGAVAMGSPQITVRLNPQEKLDFDRYAAVVGLDRSELAKLLIVRERKLRRLASLRADVIPAAERQSPGQAIRKPTVTAHLSSDEEVAAFDRYAKEE